MMRVLICFLALLFCAACGPRPVGAPTPLGAAEVTQNAVLGQDGVALVLNRWGPEARPRAVVLALHGYGDTSVTTYGPAARAWAEQGIATYAYDQRGFGANPTRRAWPGAEVLSADAVAVSRAIRARHPDVPLTVIGHSMGGGVVLAAAAEGLEADGLVLAGPAIGGGDALPLILRAGGWALGAFSANRRFTGDGITEIYPTDNPEALRALGASPWSFADPSGRELWGLVRVSDRAAAAAPAVTIPVLTLMGAQDQLVPPESVRRIHNRLPGPKRFIFYEDGWHMLFRDRQAPRVWADVAQFALSGL
ncbi:MAG: alpha/beta fold hydrolase [Pseudomonadota bacterium]